MKISESGSKVLPNPVKEYKKCNQCDKQFYYEEPLKVHIRAVHNDGANLGICFHCFYCEKRLILPKIPCFTKNRITNESSVKLRCLSFFLHISQQDLEALVILFERFCLAFLEHVRIFTLKHSIDVNIFQQRTSCLLC